MLHILPSWDKCIEDCITHSASKDLSVQGAIVIRAKEIEDEIEAGKSDKPFKTILYCNIGNPQQLGQHPVTYFRQVLALCDYPEVRPTSLTSCLRPSQSQH